MAVRVAPELRFWPKVTGTDCTECWEWAGARSTNGYGDFILAWPKRVYAHRWSYEHMVAPIPAGLDLDHLCRNRACVNPWHLEPVTRKVNLARGVRHTTLATHCPHGHEYTPDNTYRNKRGARQCRTCMRTQSRESQRRLRARRKLAASQQAVDPKNTNTHTANQAA